MRSLLFILLLCFSQLIYAKINPSNRTIALNVEAELNKNPIGKLTLSVDPNDKLSLKWSEISASFQRILFAEGLTALESKVKKDIIDKKTLESFGCNVVFDMSDFSLIISVPLSLTRPQQLSLKSTDRDLTPSKPAKLSGFINAYSSYLYQQDKTADIKDELLAIRSEAVVSWEGWVLESETEYLSEVSSQASKVKRLGTRIVRDLPLDGMRMSLGDNYSSGSYFQSTSRTLGLSLSHDFSLVSDRPIRPSASRSFTLESPSSVEVLVGERIVQKLNLAAGIYSLDDIPLNEGSNNITLKITDIAGVVRFVDFDVTTGLDLFAKGQLEYELTFGVPARLDNELEYDYDEPLISFYLDYGVTPSWTLGATAQGDEYSQQLGLKNIYAAEYGQLAFENAISFSDTTGYAYRLVYSNYRNNSANNTDLTVGYEYSSEHFTGVGYRPNTLSSSRSREHYIQANYSFSSNSNIQTSFFANLSRSYEQTKFDKAIGASLSGEIENSQWRYSLGGQWEALEAQNQWDIRLSITYKFSNMRRARFSHQSRRDKTRLEFTQDSNQRYVSALNIRAGLEKNDQNEAIFDLNTQYNANRFVMNFDHGSFYEQLTETSAYHQSRLSLASSIAFADKDWAFGKPIYDSFALITPHASLKGKKVILGLYEDKYRADNNDFDTILLSDLNSYSSTNVAVDVDNLEPGYDIGSGIVTFFSPYRTGHSVVIGTAANISVIATLFDKQSKPLSLQVGTAICIDDSNKKEHTFFTNKKGRFALTGLTACKYKVSLKNTEKSQFMIDVSEGEQLQRKGAIYVQ